MPARNLQLIAAAHELSHRLSPLTFTGGVTHVYNPLTYAAAPHETYLRMFGNSRKKVVFVGMNPGPYGMTQTGVPFGEIASVRDWMGIKEIVGKPPVENPKRLVLGFDCPNSEVSGRRLWGLFATRFGSPEAFFADHFVANYCPLVFMEAGGKNRTPDKISGTEMAPVYAACDDHLRSVIRILEPEWLIGVGGFAEGRALIAAASFPELKVARVLHPSPASPAANKDWAGNVTRTLEKLGVW
jgi:single-strand selective monofunctional uracil DNA glycosylase